MKHINKICLLILLNIAAKISSDQATDELVNKIETDTITETIGELISKVQQDGRTDYKKSHYYTKRLNYQKEGIRFIYPKKLFTKPPSINVSFGLNSLQYSSDLKITPVITSNTEFSTAIRVNKQLSGMLRNYVSEADTDDIFVYILAIGE